MWGILQEKVYKTCITDLDELKQQLRTEWAKLDHIIVAAIHHCVVNRSRSVICITSYSMQHCLLVNTK